MFALGQQNQINQISANSSLPPSAAFAFQQSAFMLRPSRAQNTGQTSDPRVEFPEENPTIDDIKQYYSIGENLETNCTSNSSIPPAKLEWWINDMPIYDSDHTIKYSTVVDAPTNRETSILGLRLPLTNEHFYRGRVKVSGRIFHVGLFFPVRDCFVKNVRARGGNKSF
jgi:hypothetical protein